MKLDRLFRTVLPAIAFLAVLFLVAAAPRAPVSQAENPNPPERVVKLIFIHHSTGGNWLADPAQNELGGGLGRALMENNYFVSATNYGWGPDSIGDATDIPNWLDWFGGSNSAAYLQALYNEDDQNFGDFGSWPRLSADPGGENEIIMFKSCFPNSELEGSPDDPPDPEGWLSVGHAKYVYNEILQYFATRPDKLFIVITAPPVQSRTYARNARAFNNWLLNDWLLENSYTASNVAVFDFYNVLTGSDAHHRYGNGRIEHVIGSRDTLFYPSGDDHPSAEGNRKAREEFVPMLNVFYNRWQSGAPAQPPPVPGATQPPLIAPPPTGTSDLIDDFEGGALEGTSGWESFWDEANPTTITCEAAGDETYNGNFSLKMEFNVAANSWSVCTLTYASTQDWSSGQGVSFYIRSSKPQMYMDVDIYSGSQDNRETYIYTVETSQETTADWIPIQILWSEFHRASWEENPDVPFSKSSQIVAFGFGIGTGPDNPTAGAIWLDDIRLMGVEAPPETSPETSPEAPPGASPEPEAEERDKPEDTSGARNPICPGGLALPLALAFLAWLLRRR